LYAQEEVEGSRKHQQLMTSARDYFMTTAVSAAGSPEIHRHLVVAAGLRAHQLLASNPGNEEDMRQNSCSLPPPDDDGWLEISPTELDAMMRRAAGYEPGGVGREAGEGDRQAAAEEVVCGVKSFVDTVSSHEGAEFPW
jgi:hypothetical protein